MIDKQTVSLILDTADIVEVVSDFVNLRRAGANYIGLCPFHNEKTPSFSVSKNKGICKCFSCGKGGSAVNFIMEHEQISYYEALKYLAKKYNIKIEERELTDKEKQTQSERESMLMINEFAAKHFKDNLHETEEGKLIGKSYFYERGFSDVTINKFDLGYSLDTKDALFNEIKKNHFNIPMLFETGLCVESKYGGGYDRYKGRVIFPIHNVAGKVIAFGGRTLKSDQAKYINSPESLIYKKSNELYGLFQAKKDIVLNDKCFLVEGYTDVISMHQAGIKNVVASSGTSLTEGQTRLIHRFTENVTVLYDGDSAGIKASLRGIDILLAEGLNVRVLLLPEGEDPDSFSRTHSATEFQNYIKEHETDFIQFKTTILMDGTENDPIKRSTVIQDIVKTIACIPNELKQSIYIQECSKRLSISEKILIAEVNKAIAKIKDNKLKTHPTPSLNVEPLPEETTITDIAPTHSLVGKANSNNDTLLYPYEEAVIQYIIRYGMTIFCSQFDANNTDTKLTLLKYVEDELNFDGMSFSNPLLSKIFNLCKELSIDFERDYENKRVESENWRKSELEKGIEEIKSTASNLKDIESMEGALNSKINGEIEAMDQRYRASYLEKRLCSSIDDSVRLLSIKLASEKYHLSKIHTKFAVVQSEYEKLITLLPSAINNWKNCIVLCRIKDAQQRLNSLVNNVEVNEILMELQELVGLRNQLSSTLGERVVNPKK